MLSFMKLNQPQLRIITLEEMQAYLPNLMTEETLQNQAHAYIMSSTGKVSTCPIQTCGQPPLAPFKCGENGQTCIKTGYINGDDIYVAKISAGGSPVYDNSGMMLIFNQVSLKLDAILMDEGVLTEIRTAAASALGSKTMLGSKIDKVEKIGIVGCGVQARWQLRFIALITGCRNAYVTSRSTQSGLKFIESMKTSEYLPDREWNISYSTPASIMNECQLIHTVTPSREPILTKLKNFDNSDWFRHITCVGADTPGKQELSVDLVKQADLIACDHFGQVSERGELQHLFSHGVSCDNAFEIGDLLSNPELTTEKVNNAVYTIFDTTGMAAQDIMISKKMIQLIDSMK